MLILNHLFLHLLDPLSLVVAVSSCLRFGLFGLLLCLSQSQILHADFVSIGQELVEAEDEVVVATEQARNAVDDSWGVHLLRFEILHDAQKLVVHLRTA